MKLYEAYRKKRYDVGGGIKTQDYSGFSSAVGMGAAVGSGLIDTVGEGDPISGRRSVGSSIGKGALSGAAMGSSFGPWGAAVGAVVGAGVGWIGGSKQKKEARKAIQENTAMQRMSDLNRSQAMLATNPEMLEGYRNSGYFATGGNLKAPLASMYMRGGYAKTLSSDNTELVGNSHSQGGIDIPQLGAEVEDGETTKGSYVFSDKLGFSADHKKIARAKGRIEKKPPTAERVNTMKLLNTREEEMIMAQEFLKHQKGLA